MRALGAWAFVARSLPRRTVRLLAVGACVALKRGAPWTR